MESIQSKPARESAGASPLLTMQNVDKQFDNGTLALRGLNLNVDAGSFVSLLGASGCGKSTVLRMIAGLTSPTRGSIHWASMQSSGHPATSPRLSCVFQEPALMPWASALKNVMLPLKIQRVERGEAESRAREALATVGLADFAKAYPRELSGGMKMRVSIARALTTTPRILLMDEPFGALDEMTRNRLNEELLALRAQQGWTVVFVTHSIPEAVFLSDRVLLMAGRPGRIVEDIPVPLPSRRTEALRSETDFLRLVGDVSRAFARTH
jgi:NitT/TauT family transport system ATP-binding protein